VASISRGSAETEVKININVSIECEIDELDGLGKKIKDIIDQVNSKDKPEEKPED
jgi:hypothetical protein